MQIHIHIYYIQINIDKTAIEEGVKGVVLIMASSTVYCIVIAINGFDLDLKYGVTWLWIIIDDICLFLMFKGNESIYNNLCGCLCNKCCINCIYGSRYEAVQTLDDDEQQDL